MPIKHAIIPSCEVPLILALEEWLLKYGSGEIMLLWQGSPAVVIGKHQDVLCETSPELLRSRGIALYRRFSGGGAVFMDGGTLLFSFIGDGSVRSFSEVSQFIREFLHTIDIEADVDERLSLYQKGLKISGVAQAVYKERFLFHCTLLVGSDLSLLEETLVPELKGVQPRVASVRAKVANIGGDISEIAKKWLAFVSEKGSEVMTEAEITLLLRHPEVQLLFAEKYTTKEWNMGGKQQKMSR